MLGMAINDFSRLAQRSYSEGRRLAGAGKERKPFSTQTKKRVWMKAGGHNPDNWRTGLAKTSKCMNPKCRGSVLKWGDKTYDWDHKDNDHSNNRESNCYLVHTYCHRKATVIKKKAVYSYGFRVGSETYKKKAEYKKAKKKPTKHKTKRTRPSSFYPSGVYRVFG